ncbi:MAG: elongation factor 4, partial [Patescibacteria group bacterium]
NGALKKNDRITFFQSKVETLASEVGHFTPFLSEKEGLSAGEIGYIVTGIKNIRLTSVGDTIYKKDRKIDPLPGYKKPKPVVFFGVYPKDPKNLGKLKETLSKIALNDTAISFSDEYSSFLGAGFRVGFLGLLHADIIRERLEREESLTVFLTTPRVLYQEDKEGIKEPYIKLTVYVPKKFVGTVINLCEGRKGRLLNISYFENNSVLEYEIPYTMFIRGISSSLKSVSSGFASLDYEPIGYKSADLVDLTISVNGEEIDVLSEKVYKEEGFYKARTKAKNLKENLPRQQFRQIIQAKIDQSIVAREEIPPFRKDVLAKMSGGDRTRKDKLLEKQKKGKEKIFGSSRINIPQKVLFSLIDSS